VLQLTLAFLEAPLMPTTPWDRLDPDARAAALAILIRLLAQAAATRRRTDAADD
jgi:hypothetical protein